ncbi:M56 family metallopeptidase [Carboxylicivirga sp. M1479]|uniref:M56 family metallopeptidase n=1 Tax=Carboxylicivirga sp. M1479 TaxID=2594476 RepID=UPI001177A387|nr:M56 family metallopeptidase [Carboxylicivirga sp. M1479]TRX66208.1 hypothetical protein FNN09_14925 [Carboxylicivirga sp. M1479]
MELYIYFFRSALVLLIFYSVYHLFLKNDAHFTSIRWFLLAGFGAAILLPLAELNYLVVLDAVAADSDFIPTEVVADDVNVVLPLANKTFNWLDSVIYLYGIVSCFFVVRILMHFGKMLMLIKQSTKVRHKFADVCVHPKIETPFVFGNRIFIKDAKCLKEPNSEILIHEMIHLKEQHWIDVFVSELFIVVQWFNPLAWLYARTVKQNLEFIADRGVLKRGFRLEKYVQTIISETMGAEVSVLANHFRFSQNKRRLKMMKNNRKSKWRQLKLLVVLPAIGGLLWAFSEPVYEYRSVSDEKNEVLLQEREGKYYLKGNVYDRIDTMMIRNVDTGAFDMKVKASPLPGTSIVVKGTMYGCVADKEGAFEVEVAKGDELVFSFVGYDTKVVRITDQKSIDVNMKTSAYELDPSKYRTKYKDKVTPPPPPKKSSDMVPPPPPPPVDNDGKPVFFVVEEMPSYEGGMENYFAQLYTLTAQAKKKETLKGVVKIQFEVGYKGGISKVKALDNWESKEANYALQFVKELENWKPGVQRGKPVSTTLIVPVEFE